MTSDNQPGQLELPFFDNEFLGKMLGGQIDNPVVQLAADKYAIGYDEIRVLGDGNGGMKWQILFKNHLVSEMSMGPGFSPADFGLGRVLSLTGIVGLTRATIGRGG